MGYRAVGLSGKDGQTVIGKKRQHVQMTAEGKEKIVDLGQVGNVDRVQPALLNDLLTGGYIPVMTCIAQDASGNSFNINGDIFAGHIAGALKADAFVVLTDIDGLLRDINDPASLIEEVKSTEIAELIASGVIQGGMIPKMEACIAAVREGAKSAYIINGTQPHQLPRLASGQKIGTKITYGTNE
jgi:acetylglutamate kinase